MAIKAVTQTNFTSGVLDPKLAAREDIAAYYNGVKEAKNLLVMPQGGCTARPGHRFIREITNVLQGVPLAGSTISAPQGGTPANLIDGNSETFLTTASNLGATNFFVVAHIDLLSVKVIKAIDVLDIFLAAGVLAGEMFVQVSLDNAAWINLGSAFDIDASKRSRRRSNEQEVTGKYIRVVRIGTTNIASTVSIGEIKVWEETDALSPVRLVPFAYSTDEAYMLCATAGNLDIIVGNAREGSISIPHGPNQMPAMNWTQSLDSLLLFHKNVYPWKVFRQGGGDEFDFRPAAFDNIPEHDYGAGTGGVNEVQFISYGNFENSREFTLLLEGQRTKTISTGSSPGATAVNIQAALRALSNTSATGISVVYDVANGGFEVTFAGDDGKQPWDEMKATVLSGNMLLDISRQTKGRYPGEAIMSVARGFPRCGLFHQGRLHLGGIDGVPDAHMMSVVGDYYNFNIEIEDDTKALLFRAETDQVGAIYNIVAGRHLSLFTNDGEFFYPAEAIKEDSAPRLTTRSGSKEGLRVFEVDGALIFIQGIKDATGDREKATSIREFLYVDTEQSYSASLISKLSSHLIKNPQDVALRKALSTDDADIHLLINEDGTGTAYTVLRSDSVNALMPIETRLGDSLIAVGVDKRRRVYFATKRKINGSFRHFLEMWDERLLLDCGDVIDISAEIKIATDGQLSFTWDFANPLDADAIGVRINGGRLSPSDYHVDLGSKTVTILIACKDGDTVRIAKMLSEVTGLHHLEGETVMTVIDGTQGGSYTISGGVLDLRAYADTEIQYGFDFDVSGKLMPLRNPDDPGLSGQKVRVVNILADIYQTGGIEVRANNGRWQEIPLVKTDEDVLDRSTQELLFTGTAYVRGLLGHAIGAPVEFRRPGPTPFTLLGMTREVSL